MSFNTFPQKVKVVGRQEFELAYFDGIDHHLSLGDSSRVQAGNYITQ